jgi:hypothetical protein
MTEIETLEQKRERITALRVAQAATTQAAQDAIDSQALDS